MRLDLIQEMALPIPRVGMKCELNEVDFRHLGAVSGAAALTFASVLAFAALVARLAATGSLAIVLAFTGMFGRRGLLAEAEAGLGEVSRAI